MSLKTEIAKWGTVVLIFKTLHQTPLEHSLTDSWPHTCHQPRSGWSFCSGFKSVHTDRSLPYAHTIFSDFPFIFRASPMLPQSSIPVGGPLTHPCATCRVQRSVGKCFSRQSSDRSFWETFEISLTKSLCDWAALAQGGDQLDNTLFISTFLLSFQILSILSLLCTRNSQVNCLPRGPFIRINWQEETTLRHPFCIPWFWVFFPPQALMH